MNDIYSLAAPFQISPPLPVSGLMMPDYAEHSKSAVLPPQSPFNDKPLWMLVVALLPQRDASTEWFSLSDIAPLLGLTPHALAKHARDLWPEHEGHWRLNYSQAVALVRRVCYAGKKLPSRGELLRRLSGQAGGVQ